MPSPPPGIDPAKLREMTSRCACLNARKVARLLSQAYDAALRPAGVRSTQLPLLATIALRGSLTLTELADSVVADRTTLSRNLRPLARNEWIRVAPGSDQRTREISLTPRGRQVLRCAIPLWDKAQARVNAVLGGDAARQLVSTLAASVDDMTGRSKRG